VALRQAVVLAGGLGTRLRPITQVMPKAMVDVNGRPFLDMLLRRLRRHGFEDCVLLVGHLGDQVIKYFADGSELGMRVRYSVEKELLGTGGALKQAEEMLDERFMVIYGDSFLPIEYAVPASLFESSGKVGLITVYRNLPRIARNNVWLGSDGLVRSYGKAVESKEMNGVEAGVIFLRREALEFVGPGKSSLEQVLFPQLIKRGELLGYFTGTRFWDIGTPEGLEEARRVLNDAD
jgi:NDP-sugar pyrophosphorylase family protein